MPTRNVDRNIHAVVRRLAIVALSLLAIPLQSAIGAVPLDAYAVETRGIGGNFTLIDQQGQATSLEDFTGKVVMLVFGYSNCPDVCPTTLARLARTRQMLGDDAQRVQVLFVSIDPARDSPERLAEYVGFFDPSFVALTGSTAEIARVAGQYKVRYSVESEKSGASDSVYAVEHSVYGYLIDTRGRVRYSFPFDVERELLAEGAERLLGETAQDARVYCNQKLSMAHDFSTGHASEWGCEALEGTTAIPLGTNATMCR